MPKIELKKFSGKLIDLLSWWSQFKKIHEDDELHITDKFQYLIQSMAEKTRGYDIVHSFPASEENYPKVINALKERFGKKKLLTQVYIRELFQMGMNNLNKKTELTSMYDSLSCHIRALETLGVTLEQSTLFLYPMVESSLPDDTLIAWQRSSLYEKDGSLESPPKGELDYLLQFLQQEVERKEQRSLVKSGFLTEPGATSKDNKFALKRKDLSTPTAANLFNGQNKNSSCIFCDKNHENKDCAKVEVWSIDDMKKRIQEKKGCLKCLKMGHMATKCRSFVKCHVCSQQHVTIMCPELKHKKKVAIAKSGDILLTQPGSGFSGANFYVSGDVLLKTVMTYIRTNNDSKKLARILFDDGCQRSCITKSIVESIESIPVGIERTRNILFDGSKTNYQTNNVHKISLSNIDGSNEIELMVREKSKIGGNISKVPKGFWIAELEENGIIFSDLECYPNQSVEVDIVIGSDYWGYFMTGKNRSLPCGLHAFETIFGWTLSGITPKSNTGEEIISMFLSEENLKNLWGLDVIGIKDPIDKLTEIQEETEAKKFFMDTVTRNQEGRYQVKLPWSNGVQEIPNNKKIATTRMLSTTKRLNATNNFETYDNIIKSWIDEGFVKQVNDEANLTKCHYLPHHPVFKESLTTPVRPVFDASCKTGRNPSLNSCLYKGPNYIELLPDVFMRFRMKLVGALSDIRKAFQMIDVDIGDREYLRFLWWEDATQQNIISLQHQRVVFGLICSPYLLAAVLEHLLLSIPEPRKQVAKQLLYVDNCVTSFDSHEEYKEFKMISIELLASAKMELRQWESTFEDNYKPIKETEETKVLGMQWNKKYDFLYIKIPSIEIPEKLTKRIIASILHKFFDPIGYSCPALLRPKIMLQNAWKKNISWDCELPTLWIDQFQRWCNEVVFLKEIKIPRLCQIPNSLSRELHTFTDASQDAYATVVFLRTEKECHVEIQLIQAKNRVTPIGKPTIPRLELLSCLIGSRLGSSVIEALNLENIPSYFWSDSTTAIAWIKRNDN